jgi:hypothetical protein
MQYPLMLLPQLKHKKIECDLTDYHLCRTTPNKQFLRASGIIKDEALCEKPLDFFDYSTSLLGHFELNNNYISIIGERKKYFTSYWGWTDQVETPFFRKDFISDNKKGIFFIPIGRIHGQVKVPFQNSKKADDEATAKIIHSPTRSNFWHFSVRWFGQNGIEINRNDAKWKYAITNGIRAALLENIDIEEPMRKLLEESDFIKNESNSSVI